MLSSMNKNYHIVVNFDRLTMLSAFSSIGKYIIFYAACNSGVLPIYIILI